MKAVAEKNTLSEHSGADSSSLDCIDTNLWLGNLSAASDEKLLTEKKIRYILTVNSFPLPKKIVDLSWVYSKYVRVFDTPENDILSYFDETYEFLESALKNGVALVHCYNGVSRSPTIVIAYLMKKKKLTMEEAFTYVKTKRKNVEPNSGFLAQLKLYETMHWALDKSNVQYKKFRLFIAANHFVKANVLPDCCIDIIKADPIGVTVDTNLVVFKCKKCRRVLAQDSNVIPHTPMEKCTWTECLKNTNICQMIYFIEPLQWMGNIVSSAEGRLLCPNATCKNKLGSFSWITGCQCPCGTVVSPGFYLIPSKVDKQRVIKVSKVKFNNNKFSVIEH